MNRTQNTTRNAHRNTTNRNTDPQRVKVLLQTGKGKLTFKRLEVGNCYMNRVNLQYADGVHIHDTIIPHTDGEHYKHIGVSVFKVKSIITKTETHPDGQKYTVLEIATGNGQKVELCLFHE